MYKKILAYVSTMVLCFGGFIYFQSYDFFNQEIAFAEDIEENQYSGSCGENATYSFDDTTGTLTISGTGNMKEYPDFILKPWDNYKLKITSIVIEDGITSISRIAFENCTSLESIYIPNSVTEIGYGAFKNCISLESISIPNGVTKINDCIFQKCISLKSVIIPNSVTEINYSAFENCTSLESIIIPNSVTKIDYGAFENCTSLESIDIPNSVTTIGYGVFKGCTSLKSLTIPQSVTNFGGGIFDCTSLESLVFEEGITEISGDGICKNCPNLTNVIIPESAISISRGFYDCTSLKNVYIPKNIQVISEYAFYNNSDDFTITGYSGTIAEIYAKQKGYNFISIGDNELNLKYLDNGLAYYINDENTITIYNYTYGDLAEIIIPETIDNLPVTKIADDCFYQNYTINKIVLPDTIVDIGNRAFYNCRLSEITLSKNLKTIGSEAFQSNTIENITIPESVVSIGDNCFIDCYDMNNITLLNNETSIGDKCFGYYHAQFDDQFGKYQDVIIHGYSNSTAETYATENEFEFLPLDDATINIGTSTNNYLLGDITNDGKINISDLLMLKKYLLGLVTDNNINLDNANIMQDDNINVADMLKLKKYLLGLITLD